MGTIHSVNVCTSRPPRKFCGVTSHLMRNWHVLVRTISQKSQEAHVSSQSVKILRRVHARWLFTAGGNSASFPIRMKRFVQAWANRILAQLVLARRELASR